MSSRPDWPRRALVASSAVFLPVVLLLVPVNDVVSTNIQELAYPPLLMRWFFVAGVAVWLAGIWLVTRFQGGIAARLWVTLPWAVLLLDVEGAYLDRHAVGIGVSAVADATVLLLVVIAAARLPWARLAAVAATVGVALLLQGAWAHEALMRKISADAVLGANTEPGRVPEPGPTTPGNVYHILLDNYLSESFAYSTGAAAAERYPGFTYFTRFNTNFPRTSSSEPALVDGRIPVPGMSLAKWPAAALDRGFWKALADAHVGVWIYPYARSMCPAYAVKCLSSFDVERDAQTAITRRTTADLWALRLFPGSFRRWLTARATSAGAVAPEVSVGFSVTDAIQAFLSRGTGGPHIVSALPTQYFNLKLFDQVLADEANRPARGQYVYYHALIPHPPYVMNERCEFVKDPTNAPSYYWAHVGCANLMVDRLVRELDRLGRLDDALIIVHADHGDMEFLLNSKLPGRGLDFALDAGARRYQLPDSTYADVGRFDGMNEGDSTAWRSMAVEVASSGLLLAKFPHARSYSNNAAPVQLLDIAPTILSHFGLAPGHGFSGMSLLDVPATREEVFFADNRSTTDGFSRYRLTARGWVFETRIPTTP